jgi:hypothetical protein
MVAPVSRLGWLRAVMKEKLGAWIEFGEIGVVRNFISMARSLPGALEVFKNGGGVADHLQQKPSLLLASNDLSAHSARRH